MVRENRNIIAMALASAGIILLAYIISRTFANSMYNSSTLALVSLLVPSLSQTTATIVFWLLMPLAMLAINLIFLPAMVEDLNTICLAVEDSEAYKSRSGEAVSAINFLTLQIYQIWWFYKQGVRLNEAAGKYQVHLQFPGWAYALVSFLLRPAALCMMGNDLNLLAKAYNAQKGSGSLPPERGGGQGENRGGWNRVPMPLQSSGMGWKEPSSGMSYAQLPPDRGAGQRVQNAGAYPPSPSAGPAVVDAPWQAVPQPALKPQGTIRIVKGQYAGNEFTISDQESIYMGRDASRCQVVFSRGDISGLHVKVQYDGVRNIYIVKDYSTNGTYLNRSRRLPKGEYTSVPVGSMITLAFGSEEFILG